MAEDPVAVQRLQEAVTHVQVVFARSPGSPNWGDGLPHHPHLRRGMSEREIRHIESRPQRLRSRELGLDETAYFMTHAMLNDASQRERSAALRYFLPVLVEQTLDPAGPGSPELGLDWIGRWLGRGGWQRWKPSEQAAVRRWLLQFFGAALMYRSSAWTPIYPPSLESPPNREPREALGLYLAAGADANDLLPLLQRLEPHRICRLIRSVMEDEAATLSRGWPWNPDDSWPPVPAAAQAPLVEYLLGPSARAAVLAVSETSDYGEYADACWRSLDALEAAADDRARFLAR